LTGYRPEKRLSFVRSPVLTKSGGARQYCLKNEQSNPDIDPDRWKHEPFIIGDLIALEPRFARLLSQHSIWACVAELLECAPKQVRFHFCNLTRKPRKIGPAVGWHRDADNSYFASHDGRTLRLLIPLQLMSARNGGTAVAPGSHLHVDSTIDNALYPDVLPGACLALHSATLHGGSSNRSDQDRDVIVIQFGLHSSTLRCQAAETLALSTREELLAFYHAL
jgi:ectoine hydroxylase-related dioxygenase (phytanoyl-CoA dioxygenase family)